MNSRQARHNRGIVRVWECTSMHLYGGNNIYFRPRNREAASSSARRGTPTTWAFLSRNVKLSFCPLATARTSLGFHWCWNGDSPIQNGCRERVARGRKKITRSRFNPIWRARPRSPANCASMHTFLAATPFSVCWLSAGCNCCTTVIVSRVRRCNFYARSRRSLSRRIRIVWFI